MGKPIIYWDSGDTFPEGVDNTFGAAMAQYKDYETPSVIYRRWQPTNVAEPPPGKPLTAGVSPLSALASMGLSALILGNVDKQTATTMPFTSEGWLELLTKMGTKYGGATSWDPNSPIQINTGGSNVNDLALLLTPKRWQIAAILPPQLQMPYLRGLRLSPAFVYQVTGDLNAALAFAMMRRRRRYTRRPFYARRRWFRGYRRW